MRDIHINGRSGADWHPEDYAAERTANGGARDDDYPLASLATIESWRARERQAGLLCELFNRRQAGLSFGEAIASWRRFFLNLEKDTIRRVYND